MNFVGPDALKVPDIITNIIPNSTKNMIGSHDNPSSASADPTPVFSSEDIEIRQVAVEDDALLMNSPLIEELSDPHIGSWNMLVSQTNWEKGAVILRWREAMIAADLPKAAYSDEAWARRVGNVTPQHVGRLRRVSERFGGKGKEYPKLFWSHFQAALDWEDAELWLEGAVQNGWSVAQMRIQRWEAVGAPEELKPRPEDIFTAEWDEDVNPRDDSPVRPAGRTEVREATIGGADIVEGFDPDAPPFEVDDENQSKKEQKKSKSKTFENADGRKTGELLTQLSDFSDFPDDMADALESLKVAILNHKLGGWKETAPKTVVACLDTMKALVVSVDE